MIQIGLFVAAIVVLSIWLVWLMVEGSKRVWIPFTSPQHLYRRYTPREWLSVLFLILLIGYVIHNERRAFIIIHAEIVSIENSRLQQQLIDLNQERLELLHELMFVSHRLPLDAPAFPGGDPMGFERDVEMVMEEER